MTATQFVKRRNLILHHGMTGIGFLALIVMGLACVLAFTYKTHARAVIIIPCVGVISMVLVIAGGVQLMLFLHARFVEAHPEMQFISAWENFGYDLDGYPVTPLQKDARQAELFARLTGYAQEVNYQIACRDALPKIVDTMPEQQRATIEWNFTTLNAEVDRRNQRYRDYFLLVVKGQYAIGAKMALRGLAIVPIPIWDPKQFRESLLPQAVADETPHEACS